MTTANSVVAGRAPRGPNRLAPMRFVIAFGAVSMLADFVTQALALATFAPLAADRRVASTGEEEADGP